MTLAAIIFDFDGTIVETEAMHYQNSESFKRYFIFRSSTVLGIF